MSFIEHGSASSVASVSVGLPRRRVRMVWDHRTDDAVDGLPAFVAQSFWKRVLLVAQPGEIVLASEGEALELPLLNRLGFGCRPEDVRYASPTTDVQVDGLGIRGAEVDFFTGKSAICWAHARAYECRPKGASYEVATLANSKRWLQRQGLGTPAGHVVESAEELSTRVAGFHTEGIPAIYKPDCGASGWNQIRFPLGIDAKDLVEKIATASLPGVIQELVPKNFDFSFQFEIQGPRAYAIKLVTGQIVDEHGDFLGGYGPLHLFTTLPAYILDRAFALARAAIRKLSEEIFAGSEDDKTAQRFVGEGSIDIMADLDTGAVWLTEINARKSAQWYPIAAMKRKYGTADAPPYLMRSFLIPRGMEIGALEEVFKPVLFRERDACGFVPFCFLPDAPIVDNKAHKEYGFCYGVTYGDPHSQAKLFKCVKDIQARLAA